MDVRYPNTRGQMPRDKDKRIRVATHEPVVKLCLDALHPLYIVEHGMGISSTPLFHCVDSVKTILSYEDDVNWQACNSCTHGASKQHTIVSWSGDADLERRVREFDTSRTLGFVDGVAIQRYNVIDVLQRLNVPFIIDHDAETYETYQLMERYNLCRLNGYVAFQYIGKNPETALYISSNGAPAIDLTDDFVRLFP